ncbi:hypothetical protein TNCV_1213081, partial [Trichonephila clavipes]
MERQLRRCSSVASRAAVAQWL